MQKDVVLPAIFSFANLTLKDTKYSYIILSSDEFEFITRKLCENKWIKKVPHFKVEQCSMFQISAQAKYTHFQKILNIHI